MKLTILQENLKEGVAVAERISSKSLTLPVLNNVLLKTEGSFLGLTSTDLECAVNWWSLAKIEKPGQIAVSSRLFSSFLGLLPNKKITLNEKNNNLFVECDNQKTSVKGVGAEDFPLMPKMPSDPSVVINNKALCESLNQVVDVPVVSTARPEISGVYFCFDGSELTTAATDSFRLGEKKTVLSGHPLKEQISFILPAKAAKEIINIFNEKAGELKIYISPNQVMFESLMAETNHPHIQFFSRLIEGEYPNYQEIIPKKYETKLTLQRGEFLNQIKLASLFSSKVSEVKIKANPQRNEVEFFSQNPELGEYQSSLEGKIEGKPVEMSFNYRFLIDGLSNIKSSEVALELNGESGPGVIRPVGDQSYVYIVMPIKTN